MSNWFRTWNASKIASYPVFASKTNWLNATARTKRDGGVKSPGGNVTVTRMALRFVAD
jgi:hypothetical protein